MELQGTRLAFCIFAALTNFSNGNAIPSSDASLADVVLQLTSIDEKLGTIAGHFADQDPDNFQCYKGMQYKSVTKFPRVPFKVLEGKAALCDTVTDGGGWIVLQRRTNGIENFNRSWSEYKSGFGDVFGEGDFWIGNDVIHQLTASEKYELRVEMDLQGATLKSRYTSFYVGDEASNYNMMVGRYTGDSDITVDMMKYQNNTGFTTYDRDNDAVDVNLAQLSGGGWWHNDTDGVDLNGISRGAEISYIVFPYYSSSSGRPNVTFTEMKMRPVAWK